MADETIQFGPLREAVQFDFRGTCVEFAFLDAPTVIVGDTSIITSVSGVVVETVQFFFPEPVQIGELPPGGRGLQEVYIGAPETLPPYPALVFDAVTIDGEEVYQMSVNVP